MRKNKKVGKKFGLHNGAIRRLHTGAGFRDYRSEQERTNWDSFRDFKSG